MRKGSWLEMLCCWFSAVSCLLTITKCLRRRLTYEARITLIGRLHKDSMRKGKLQPVSLRNRDAKSREKNISRSSPVTWIRDTILCPGLVSEIQYWFSIRK